MELFNDFLRLTLSAAYCKSVEKVDANGTLWNWKADGVLEIIPQSITDQSVDLLLSAGIHGNETAPIELLNGLISDIANLKIILKARVLIILGNPSAIRENKRFIDQDLNRLFGEEPSMQRNTLEGQRALEIKHWVGAFGERSLHENRQFYHYDMHTTIRGSLIEHFAIYPSDKITDTFFAHVTQSHMQAILFNKTNKTTFAAYTCQLFSGYSATLELGRSYALGCNNLTRLNNLFSYLCALLSDNCAEGPSNNNSISLFLAYDEIVKSSNDFQLCIADNTKNFTVFAENETIAQDANTLHTIKIDGTRLVFINPKVAIGLRAGILARSVKLEQVLMCIN